MLWNQNHSYHLFPYAAEADLEAAVNQVKDQLFGASRIYIDDKRKIGKQGKTRNLPDGYLIDLNDPNKPRIYVVENDLARHQDLKHVAVQVLEFSLSFESSKIKVKNIIKESLQKCQDYWDRCEKFAQQYGYENVDYLLERIIHEPDSFNAMLIIDEVSEDLETVLMSRFKFPVEIIILKRYKSEDGDVLYEFDPFLSDITTTSISKRPQTIDTIVVPAREEGFNDVFLGKNCWYSIRLNASMIPSIKYIAAYQVAPISAITHIAQVHKIEQYQDTNKYILYFEDKAKKIKPIKLGKNPGKAPQSSRYASYERLRKAKSIDEVFWVDRQSVKFWMTVVWNDYVRNCLCSIKNNDFIDGREYLRSMWFNGV